MSRIDELNKILRSLQAGTPDIEAAALISEDGLVIASVLPQQLEEIRIAGMSATLLSLGTRASAELGRGNLKQVIIRGDRGYIVMINASPGTLLLSLSTQDARLGLIFLEMERAAASIKNIF